MSEELKACPFCGSDEIGMSVNWRGGVPYDYVVCPTANCYVSGQHNDPGELKRWWNTRPSVSEEKIAARVADAAGVSLALLRMWANGLNLPHTSVQQRVIQSIARALIGEVK